MSQNPKSFGLGCLRRVQQLLQAPNRSHDIPQPERGSEGSKCGSFEALLDLLETASMLGVHPKTLEKMARTRKVPALKVGKRWKFRLSSLNVWLENGFNSNQMAEKK
jgi:excisionase family DNA binding protein